MFLKSEALWKQMPISGALHNISFGVPSKGAFSPGPPHGVPLERDAPFLEATFIHLSKSPIYEIPSRFQVPLSHKGAPMERDAPFLEATFIHLSKSPVYEPPSRFQVPLSHKGAPMERGARNRSLS